MLPRARRRRGATDAGDPQQAGVERRDREIDERHQRTVGEHQHQRDEDLGSGGDGDHAVLDGRPQPSGGSKVGCRMAEHPLKTTAEQVTEITKLVADAQGKLDQVVRALRTLEDRLHDESDGGATSA
jgi:hypothetical protein